MGSGQQHKDKTVAQQQFDNTGNCEQQWLSFFRGPRRGDVPAEIRDILGSESVNPLFRAHRANFPVPKLFSRGFLFSLAFFSRRREAGEKRDTFGISNEAEKHWGTEGGCTEFS